MKKFWLNRRWLCLLFGILACFLLGWCGGWDNKNKFAVNVWNFELDYVWDVKLSKVALKTDDLDEIVDLYQEEWDDTLYKDSLLIAKRYSQWLGIGAFVQENLDSLEENGLTLSNINKKWVQIDKDGENINLVLVEYEISDWLIEELPLLFLSQLFIPDWNEVWLVSFISDNLSSRKSMSNSFKKIR